MASDGPAARPHVVFEVLSPRYGTWWFRGLAAALVAGALLLAYRLRVASLLKLERQRMRIAMDLHDEVGSGLGSIGVLAGILARPELSGPQREDLTGRITGVARELSQSLGDIVWSLRTGSGNLDSLWAKILDRARPLFAGGSPALRIVAPDPVWRRPVARGATERLAHRGGGAAQRGAARRRPRGGSDPGRRRTAAGSLHRRRRAWLSPRAGDTTRRGSAWRGCASARRRWAGPCSGRHPTVGAPLVVIRFRAGGLGRYRKWGTPERAPFLQHLLVPVPSCSRPAPRSLPRRPSGEGRPRP
jgi:hypothetical protein